MLAGKQFGIESLMVWTADQIVERLYKMKAPKVAWLPSHGIAETVSSFWWFRTTVYDDQILGALLCVFQVLAFVCLLLVWNPSVDLRQDPFQLRGFCFTRQGLPMCFQTESWFHVT